jgi:hypothetical protein
MRVRLQMGQATPVHKDRPKNQRVASAAAVLLAPFAALAGVLAIWRIAAEMNVASAFLFESGAFSHWAVWGAAAVVMAWAAHRLNQYGGPPVNPYEDPDAKQEAQQVEERR